MNKPAENQPPDSVSDQGLTTAEVCALAIVLKVRGTAQSIGFTIKYQQCNSRTLQFLMSGPCIAFRTGQTKASFEEILSLSEMATFRSAGNAVEIMLRFNLKKLAETYRFL